MRLQVLSPEFVECIPERLQDGVLYVSMVYATAVHACCCGCGREVVTPFSPVDWKLVFDGETVSLSPSIGNWNFTCMSHYFIRQNKIVWAAKMSKLKIEAGRAYDKDAKAKHYGDQAKAIASIEPESMPEAKVSVDEGGARSGLWERIKAWVF